MTEITLIEGELPRWNWGWAGINIASWLLGEFVYDWLGRIFFFTSKGFLPIIIFAVLIALGQWFYLRRVFQKIVWWLPATIVGLSIYFFIAEIQLILAEFGRAPIILVVVLIGWSIVGILQWLVLRSYLLRAGWWILGSTAGLLLSKLISNLASALAFAILFSMSNAEIVTLNSSTTIPNLIVISMILLGTALGYLVYGLITGYVLHRLSLRSLLDEEELARQET